MRAAMTSALSVLISRLNVRIPATCLLFIFTCRRTSGDHLKTSAFNSWTSAFSCSTSEFRSSNESAVVAAASWPAVPPADPAASVVFGVVSVAVGVVFFSDHLAHFEHDHLRFWLPGIDSCHLHSLNMLAKLGMLCWVFVSLHHLHFTEKLPSGKR